MPAVMTNRERYRTVFARQIPDRVPIAEAYFWPEAVERWRGEGLPADVSPYDYFGMDPIADVHFDGSLQLPAETLEETDEFVITRDNNGRTIKSWRSKTATPFELDHAIKTPDDWRALRDRLTQDEGRITDEMRDSIRQTLAADSFCSITPGIEPLWWVVMVLGYERSLLVMAEDPEWVEEMVRYQTELSLRGLQRAVDEGINGDAVWYWADLCYRNGMLISPRMYRQLVLPHHKRIAQFCHEHDMTLMLHCCGLVTELLPLVIEAGFDVIQPLEGRCGNDVRVYKRQYGNQIAFFGNIAVDVLAKGPEAAEAEVRGKVSVAMENGAYAFHSDHSVPPTVSFAAYKRAVEVCREIGSYA